jgi:uncharacterized protein YdhG (YjbR/CyaY superfamily)
MPKSKNDPAAVDAYLGTLTSRERETLQNLRALIKETVPKVEERISYGTAVMFSRGLDLFGVRRAAETSLVPDRQSEAGGSDEGRDCEDPQGQRRDDPLLS